MQKNKSNQQNSTIFKNQQQSDSQINQENNNQNNNNNWDPITNSSTTDSPLSTMDNALSENNSELEDYVPDELPSGAASHSSRLASMDIQEDSIENCLNLPKTVNEIFLFYERKINLIYNSYQPMTTSKTYHLHQRPQLDRQPVVQQT